MQLGGPIIVSEIQSEIKAPIAYLDFNKLLDAIHDHKMFISIRGLPDQHFISRLQPSPILVPHESLGVGLLIVEVSQNDGRRLHDHFTA